MAREIFRTEALEKLSSPEDLERPFELLPAKSWMALAAIVLTVLGAGIWSYFGRIPETVDGPGVLISPGRVRSLQSSYGGQIIDLKIRVGQAVAKNDLLAVINQSDLKQALDQANTRLRELELALSSQVVLSQKRIEREKVLRYAQETLLKQNLDELESFSKKLADNSANVLDREAKGIEVVREQMTRLNTDLKKQLDDLRRLEARRLVTSDAVIAAESSVVSNEIQITELNVRLLELSVRDIEAGQTSAQMRSRQTEIRSQLSQLELDAIKEELNRTDSQVARAQQIREQKDRVAQLEHQLTLQGEIRSPAAGRLVELSVNLGQVVVAGARLGALELDTEDGLSDLRNLGYFPLASGKRLEPGMLVAVTPSTVQRARYGGIYGKITRVSPYPITEESATAIIGNPEIVRALSQPGGMIEVEIELENSLESFSGFRWTSGGPRLKFSAGTTTMARVTVNQKPPIAFVFPSLAPE